MKVLVAGYGGQLAWELERGAPSGMELVLLDAHALNICDRNQVLARVAEHAPDVVVNAAAYTAVDKAEAERSAAFAVNADGAGYLAEACEKQGAYFLHVSTDFVFDGTQSTPYVPQDPMNPLSVYGASKAEGERKVRALVPDSSAIIRTAWVYSSFGNNFVKTMLRLMAERPSLNVVADQVGTPTWAAGLAAVCWEAIENRLVGTYHWTDAGIASWYDFAVAIRELALDMGLLEAAASVNPIPSSAYPTPARRPAYSVLDKTELYTALPGVTPVHWRTQLARMLAQYKQENSK